MKLPGRRFLTVSYSKPRAVSYPVPFFFVRHTTEKGVECGDGLPMFPKCDILSDSSQHSPCLAVPFLCDATQKRRGILVAWPRVHGRVTVGILGGRAQPKKDRRVQPTPTFGFPARGGTPQRSQPLGNAGWVRCWDGQGCVSPRW